MTEATEKAVGSAEGVRRTCAACRVEGPAQELVRLVLDDEGRTHLDPAHRLAGRGAYLCSSPACFERAFKKGGLSRAFDRPVSSPGAELLGQEWMSYLIRTTFNMLGLAERARCAGRGVDAVRNLLIEGEPLDLVISAEDLADGSRRRLLETLERHAVSLFTVGTMDDLGAATGSKPVGAIGLSPGPMAQKIRGVCRFMLQFRGEGVAA